MSKNTKTPQALVNYEISQRQRRRRTGISYLAHPHARAHKITGVHTTNRTELITSAQVKVPSTGKQTNTRSTFVSQLKIQQHLKIESARTNEHTHTTKIKHVTKPVGVSTTCYTGASESYTTRTNKSTTTNALVRFS